MKTMEQNMNQNLHILAKNLTNIQRVKMITQLLLSLSVFSFIFSKPSLLSFLHSLNFCLSTFPYQFFTHTIDKNFMFLLCNGLLVFLAKYSGFTKLLSLSSHQENQADDLESMTVNRVSRSDGLSQTFRRNEEAKVLEAEVCAESDITVCLPQDVDIGNQEAREGEEEDEKEFFDDIQGDTKIEKEIAVENKEQEKESEVEEQEEESVLAHVEEDTYEEKDIWDDEDICEEEEEEEGLGNGKLSTEELNKKFDDFIRRMKEDLRIEAQRHLIMV